MTVDEKIKYVREAVYELEKLKGVGVAEYGLIPVESEFGGDDIFASFFGRQPNNTPVQKVVLITVDEQVDILRRLEKEKLITILDLQKNVALLKVAPLHPSPIKIKTLENISRTLADKFTGTQIVDILLDYGIPRCDIPYPNTKWRTLQDMFTFLGTSPNPDQREKFGGAITTFLHPLNFGADESISQELITEFNKYLQYDGYEIVTSDDGDGYKLTSIENGRKIKPLSKPVPTSIPDPMGVTARDLADPITIAEDYSERSEEEAERLKQPIVADALAVAREAYKTLMAITSSFCHDPNSPSRDLNSAYIALSQEASKTLTAFCGDMSTFEIYSFDEYKKNNFGIPFSSLYKAELEFKNKKKELNWNEIRPEMNAVLGQIEDFCQTANAPEVISEPRIQKIIGDAMLILSQIAAERKGVDHAEHRQPIQMEIIKIPELQMRNADEGTIVKGTKRVHLPKFKPTDWSNITIRFIDDRNVIIKVAKKEQVLSDYDSLGFANEKRDTPNRAWHFFLELAKNNGSTSILPVPIPDTIKQLKKQLSDRLKTIFKNDTDPFFDPTDDHMYRIKIEVIPPSVENAPIDTLGTKEYLQETMVEVTE